MSSDRGEMAFPKASPTSQTKTAPRSAVEQTKDLELELLRCRGIAASLSWTEAVFFTGQLGGDEAPKARRQEKRTQICTNQAFGMRCASVASRKFKVLQQ